MISYSRSDHVIEKKIDTGSQTVTIRPYKAYRTALVSTDDGVVTTGGDDSEAVTVRLVDGLAVARGTSAADADVLDESGSLTLSVDGSEVTVDISGGTGSTEVSTTKSAGSTITVSVVEYSDGPVEGDSATIEVVA